MLAVILIVIGTEVFNETSAKRAMAALASLAEPTALVRREGRTIEIPAEASVPGDVLLLQAGQRVYWLHRLFVRKTGVGRAREGLSKWLTVTNVSRCLHKPIERKVLFLHI